MSANLLLSRLQGVQGRGPRWRAICPAHESKHATRSLAIFEAEDGRLLIHCFAGCGVQETVDALGMELSDLFPPRIVDDHRRLPIRKPWRLSDLVSALRGELVVALVILSDVKNGLALGATDRARAGEAFDALVHLSYEIENAY